jgi:phytoene dehydrogenase-like protein
MEPLAERWLSLAEDTLKPPGIPKHPILLARLGVSTLRLRSLFRGARARSLFAGLAAHSCLPLEHPIASAVALILGLSAHRVGWPFPRGGAARLAEALIGRLELLGATVRTSAPVHSLSDLMVDGMGAPDLVLCDVTPRQLLTIAKDRLPAAYRDALRRYRYGPGAYKVDWALDGPAPWRAKECLRAATVHVGGTCEEIEASERAAWEGRISESPFCLVAQHSLFDATRAPAGKHTLWAYCHVPNGSDAPMADRIETQIERFAPGFRARILARNVMPPAKLEELNANLVGGDINGGTIDIPQFLFRPSRQHYRTPVDGLFLCSSSTPPGGGVHGMCGYHAAQAALRAKPKL